MALTVGDRLGHYDVTALIGEGGMGQVYRATDTQLHRDVALKIWSCLFQGDCMGEVYRARDTRLDRTVAIKVLPEHVAADPDLKQRFEREAKTISSLNHPHICTLYDIGNQDG